MVESWVANELRKLGVFLHAGTEALALDEQTLAVPFGVFFGRERG